MSCGGQISGGKNKEKNIFCMKKTKPDVLNELSRPAVDRSVEEKIS